METARHRKKAVTAYVFYVILFYTILIGRIEPFFSYSSTFSLIGHFLAFPMYWIGLNIHPGDRRWPWIWFAATEALYFIGDLLWAYKADWLGVAVESPSVCDFFYLLNSYTCCCAFICYIRQIKDMYLGNAFMDIFISVLAIGGLLYRFIILPLVMDESVGLFQMFLHANMSVIDLALFAAILAVILGTGQSRFYTKRTLLLGLSFFLCCFVEQLSLAIEVYELPIGFFFDPFWAVPFWFFALTATYPDEDEEDEEETAAFHRKWEKTLRFVCLSLPYFLTVLILFLVGPKAAWDDVIFRCVLILTAIHILLTLYRHFRRQHVQPSV